MNEVSKIPQSAANATNALRAPFRQAFRFNMLKEKANVTYLPVLLGIYNSSTAALLYKA